MARDRKRVLRAAFLATLTGVCFCAAGAALAMPVEMAFSGTIDSVEGSVPDASVVVGAAFAGTIRYDSDQPESCCQYDFADGSAALNLSVDSTGYQTDPANSAVNILLSTVFIDLEGELWEGPVPPASQPDWLPHEQIIASSGSNLPVAGQGYTIELSHLEPVPWGSFDPLVLPDSAEGLASILLGGQTTVQGDAGWSFSGTVTSAVPIPEPCTGLLLACGLTGLALARRRAA